MSGAPSVAPSISDKFSLAPDPYVWGSNISPNEPEADDDLHNPDPRRDRKHDTGGTIFTYRGLSNVGCLTLLCVGLITLFAGFPLISHFTSRKMSTNGGFNLGGINGSGQVPEMPGNWGLIDSETPHELYTKPSYLDPSQEMTLVFSDEFNTDGRSFYPGDDPYWEAADLHYWETNNMEWYDPEAITTKDGFLQITLSRKETHDLNFEGGMMSTWNKFCFTGGILEASVQLPGTNNIVGLWPAVWAMGNLGRAGYGASLEGLWPYTYDNCDVGTAPNQTFQGQPLTALTGNDPTANGALSFLPGQRLSRCTCAGESHPGPVHKDGTFVGRSAPEIDVFEAQITGEPLTGQVSQSAQWAPFNVKYDWFNTTDNLIIADPAITELNPYKGGAFQQATSGVTETNQGCYELEQGCFSTYAFEYKPGMCSKLFNYITWIADSKIAWTLKSGGMAADDRVGIAARPVPQEPMYLIANLGMSTNFGTVDIEHLTFPTTMKIDWIRVYQPSDQINIGCDPDDFPTQAYINQYIEAYTNPNLTTWVDDYKQPWPKSSFLGQC
ncbi:glycoside hydrolase family 16 protein [Macrolepiota fuliginosa MF-IS2]|uniref:Glycoside hydrolase family 16 protein n=1 Tax=Macrolepiota fuliginosa MF-IS2 TaxID=1400762 RepID=A0A9P5XR72_9AGAR|nr:glycoside hydrolase family 16 protein [Macrolepiota fuliginosa MF-IS2]